ncbi:MULTISPECIES: hypothetical protein [unclassified Streptomyces]|uniref:hypothetical protein n=1 Tax=unclassified Streptomyces TaxID=2593676 RepID=UPI001BECA4FD|nr:MULTISPECIES: hypothetical protein [unclassified Streptomyces]MBT2406285.1 hypothetical protein [Streptomyces sp. ISL-21]MBT2607398.1 hypothetical protein [Streptomyces sp. ISL-87]
MSENMRDQAPEYERDVSETLRETLHTLLGSASAPPPALNDEELIAKIRASAENSPPEKDFE